MNIRNVESILRSVNLPKESLEFADNYTVGNLSGFKVLMNKINDLHLFKAPREMLLGSSIYTTNGNSIKVPDSEYNKIQLMHGNLVNGISALLDAFQEIQPQEDAESVTIKIPDPSNFNEAVEFQSDFLIAISQNVESAKIGGKVILTAWEPSPFRLTLNLGSSLAVGLVGGMARAAAAALKKHQEGRMFEHMVKGLDVKKDAIQEILRGLQAYVDSLLVIQAKRLYAKSFGEPADPDGEARLLHGIKLFRGLIEKGAELRPSSKASESVRGSFPDFTKLSLMGPGTDHIEDAENLIDSTKQQSTTSGKPGGLTEVERLEAA
jgi:hypothetical protein